MAQFPGRFALTTKNAFVCTIEIITLIYLDFFLLCITLNVGEDPHNNGSGAGKKMYRFLQRTECSYLPGSPFVHRYFACQTKHIVLLALRIVQSRYSRFTHLSVVGYFVPSTCVSYHFTPSLTVPLKKSCLCKLPALCREKNRVLFWNGDQNLCILFKLTHASHQWKASVVENFPQNNPVRSLLFTIAACARLRIAPSSHVLDRLSSDCLSVRHMLLSPISAEALSAGLSANRCIRSLNLGRCEKSCCCISRKQNTIRIWQILGLGLS